MTSSQDFFVRQCAGFSRDLPVGKSIEFMRGLLETCPVNELTEELRDAFNRMVESDAQLKTIQDGQLKLNLPDQKPKPTNGHDGDGDGSSHH